MATTLFFRKDGWIKSVLGPAIPGAQIWVCQQPANVTSLPPSPLASVFSDPNGLVPLTLPAESDGFGHYSYYIAPGLYTEIISLNNVIQQVYPDQSFGLGNAGPGNPYVAGSNITIVGNVISATVPPSQSVELQTNGVDNTLQTKLNLKNGTGISLSSDAVGGVTITNANPNVPSSTTYFSRPNWINITGNWVEVPNSIFGMIQGGIGVITPTLIPATVNSPPYLKLTGTATANDCAFYFGTNKPLLTSVLKNFKIPAFCFSATALRYWIGMTDTTSAGSGTFEFDNPAVNFIGFRFSTAASDTKWIAYCSTDGTHFTAVNTGVAIDITGAEHVFEADIDQGVPGTIKFLIDGVQVASISTNVPSTSTGLIPFSYCECLTSTTGVPIIGGNLFYAEIYQ